MMAEFDASYIATLTFQLFYERTKIKIDRDGRLIFFVRELIGARWRKR